MTHGRTLCSCGRVIKQCRCIEGHRNVTTIPHPACLKQGQDWKPEVTDAEKVTALEAEVIHLEAELRREERVRILQRKLMSISADAMAEIYQHGSLCAALRGEFEADARRAIEQMDEA